MVSVHDTLARGDGSPLGTLNLQVIEVPDVQPRVINFDSREGWELGHILSLTFPTSYL